MNTQMVTYALAGLIAYGYLTGGAPVVTTPTLTQPAHGARITAVNYPHNITVRGKAVTSMSIELFEGTNLIDSTIAPPGSFTASLTVEGPGPHQIKWTDRDSQGNTITGTISITIETQVTGSLEDAIGVNIHAGFQDPVLGLTEARAPVSPNMNFVKTWVDRLARDGIKYVRLTLCWEAMFPLATKQQNCINQIGNWIDYLGEKGIYVFPTFFTGPHYGLPSSSAANATNNEYARGFPKYCVQNYLPSNDTNNKRFFDGLYSGTLTGAPNIWDDIFNNFWKPILERVDNNDFVLGYELCNEPPAYDTAQVTGLGNFHTALAQKIREWGSSKYIMFVQGFPQGGGGWWNNNYNVEIAPRVDNIVYCPHNYAGVATLGWPQRFSDRMNAFKNTQAALNCPVIVDEFGIGLTGADSSTILTQANMNHIFQELQRCKFGGMCWAYWPGANPGGISVGLHRMIESNGVLTPNYGVLYMNSRRAYYGY